MRVPQIMQPNPRHLGPLHDHIERAVEVVGIEQLAVAGAEHEVVVVSERRGFASKRLEFLAGP